MDEKGGEVSPNVEQMIVDGLKSIFERLGKVEEKISEVSVQKNEIGHINRTLLELKETDDDLEERLGVIEVSHIKNHSLPGRRVDDPEAEAVPVKKERPLLEQAWRTAIVASVAGGITLIFAATAFTVYLNLPRFFDFQKSQVNADHALPTDAKPEPKK